MAKQHGVVNLRGAIGDVTFSRSEDGYHAGKKSSVNAERIANDPAFIRTRENNREFGSAGKGAKLICSAFRTEAKIAKDSKLTSRMVKVMMKAVKADPVNGRGDRNLSDGTPEMLEGFEFSRHAEMGSTMYAQATSSIDRVTGNMTINIPSFIPKLRVIVPDGATHFKIISAGSEIDFENETHETVSDETPYLPWDNTATAPIILSHPMTPNSTKDLMLVWGIQFCQIVNGFEYPLLAGNYNALSMLKVDEG